MINPQWLELPVSRTNLHGPKAVRPIGVRLCIDVQYNLNGSNPDGSITPHDSNSFFSPYKILPIAQENKYLGSFSCFMMELYVVCTH